MPALLFPLFHARSSTGMPTLLCPIFYAHSLLCPLFYAHQWQIELQYLCLDGEQGDGQTEYCSDGYRYEYRHHVKETAARQNKSSAVVTNNYKFCKIL